MSVSTTSQRFSNKCYTCRQLDVHLTSSKCCSIGQVDGQALCSALVFGRESNLINITCQLSIRHHCLRAAAAVDNLSHSRHITDIDVTVLIGISRIEGDT